MLEMTTVPLQFLEPPSGGDCLRFDLIRGSWYAGFQPCNGERLLGEVFFLRDVEVLNAGSLYLQWRVTIVDPARRFSVKCGGGEGIRLLGRSHLGAIILTQDPEEC